MAYETKVTRKFQVTIPKKIRSMLGIHRGDILRVKVEDGRIVMEPVVSRVTDPVKELLSIFDSPIPIDAVKLVEESWDED